MIRKKDLAIFNIASKDTSRPVLWAVKVNYIEEEKKLVFVATDGYQLTETVVRDLDYTPNFTEILIPNTDFEAAAKLAKASLGIILKILATLLYISLDIESSST